MDSLKNGGLWIWNKDLGSANQYVQFVQKFDYDEADTVDVFLNISADSQYAAWVNGQPAAFGQYPDYPEYKVYDRIGISHLLRRGENTLCVLGYCQNEDSSVYRKGIAGIWFEIEAHSDILASSGENSLCRAAPDYQSGDMEKVSPQLSFSFKYDGRRNDGWNEEGYSATESWERCSARENTLVLHPRPVRKLALEPRKRATICSQGVFFEAQPAAQNIGERMQNAYMGFRDLHSISGLHDRPEMPDLEGIRFTSTEGHGIYIVIDLGSEEAGLIDLELRAPAGTVIHIGHGEHLDDLRVRAFVGGRTFAAQYVCRDARQSFTHYMKRAGCRYVQLNIYAGSFTLYYAGLIPTPYPLSERGTFRCSDSLHNRIYETSLRTLRLCMHEHYEDTPWREQALYSMDSRNQMLCGYYAFGEYDFAKASIRLMGLSQRTDGLLELCSPARVPITIPSFSLTWIIQLYEYVWFSGDVEFGREMYDTARAVMSTFTNRIDHSGLIPCFSETPYWNFYEWANHLDGGAILREYELPLRYDAPLNAFCSYALGSLAELARLMELPADAVYYRTIQSDINERMAAAFWDEDLQLFCTFVQSGIKAHYAELTHCLMIICGACPDHRKERVLASLSASDSGLVPVTLSSSIFKYDALLTMPDKYGIFVLEEIASLWGRMLFSGATSFWETADGGWDFDRAGSLSHGWSAVPVYIYYAYLLGVTPASPGFQQCKSSPIVSPVVWAAGTVPSSDGAYEVSVANHYDIIQSKLRKIIGRLA